MKERQISLGKVGIDTGTLLLVDPCNVDGVDLEKVFKLTEGPKQGGSLKYGTGKPGLGVSLTTGLGDGFYEVTATMRDLGPPFGERITKIEVEFVPDGWEDHPGKTQAEKKCPRCGHPMMEGPLHLGNGNTLRMVAWWCANCHHAIELQ